MTSNGIEFNSFSTKINIAKKESRILATLEHSYRCQIIKDIAMHIQANTPAILTSNQQDIEQAKHNNTPIALLDRLTLTEDRVTDMCEGMLSIADLPNPLITESEYINPDNQLIIKKQRVPLGLILVVYEARPNVGTDTVAISLKTGNAVILKGSKHTKYTNQCIQQLVSEILIKYNIKNCIMFETELSYEQTAELISHSNIDLIIPRGGENLKNIVNKLAKAPVLGAGGGVCHAYISEFADLKKASEIITNAKTHRPSVCNALESVLIHKSLMTKDNLDLIFNNIMNNCSVKVVASQDIQQYLNCDLADDSTWSNEYLDLQLSAKSVDSLEDAINHINTYSTGHSDCIISENIEECQLFMDLVDSSCVYSNASTRFTDGSVFGFGAEIGISTQKLHARGPIGIKELTSYKYQIVGNGQIR